MVADLLCSTMSESASTQPPSDYIQNPQSPLQNKDNNPQAFSQLEGESISPSLEELPGTTPPSAQVYVPENRKNPAVAHFEIPPPSGLYLASLTNPASQPAQVPLLESNAHLHPPSQPLVYPIVPVMYHFPLDPVNQMQKIRRLQRKIILTERRRLKRKREALRTPAAEEKKPLMKRSNRSRQICKSTEKNATAINEKCPQ